MAGKNLVSAVEAARDVRSGMDAAALMKKYNLSAKGLGSLLEKLLAVRAITRAHIDALLPPTPPEPDASQPDALQEKSLQIDMNELMQDIRNGMHDFDLMEKYELSLEGLQKLLDFIVAKEFMAQDELDQRIIASASTVDLTSRTELGVDELNEPQAQEGEELIDLTWVCPVCGIYQSREYAKCPECGALVALLKRKPPST